MCSKLHLLHLYLVRILLTGCLYVFYLRAKEHTGVKLEHLAKEEGIPLEIYHKEHHNKNQGSCPKSNCCTPYNFTYHESNGKACQLKYHHSKHNGNKHNQGLVGKAGTTATVADFEAGKLVIGVQRSCSADQWMADEFGQEKYDQMVKDGKIKLYDSFPQSMVALEQGLVECVIFDDVNIETYIKGNDAFQMIGVIKTGEVYAIAMRNEDTDLHALINEGLAELMASEKWEELKLKYIVTE